MKPDFLNDLDRRCEFDPLPKASRVLDLTKAGVYHLCEFALDNMDRDPEGSSNIDGFAGVVIRQMNETRMMGYEMPGKYAHDKVRKFLRFRAHHLELFIDENH